MTRLSDNPGDYTVVITRTPADGPVTEIAIHATRGGEVFACFAGDDAVDALLRNARDEERHNPYDGHMPTSRAIICAALRDCGIEPCDPTPDGDDDGERHMHGMSHGCEPVEEAPHYPSEPGEPDCSGIEGSVPDGERSMSTSPARPSPGDTGPAFIAQLRDCAAGCCLSGRWIDGLCGDAIDGGTDEHGESAHAPEGFYDASDETHESLRLQFVDPSNPAPRPPIPDGIDECDVPQLRLAEREDGTLVWLGPATWEPYTQEDQAGQLDYAASLLRRAAARIEALEAATAAETVVAAAAEGGERWGAAIASEVERQIAECLVRDALALGYRVTVNDGGETTLRDSSHLTAVGAALATTAWDWLSFRDTAGTVVGCVHLIWGNGAAVISDHTANDALDAILAGANALADRFGA